MAPTPDRASITWRKSSHSPSSDCVQLGARDGAWRHIGDTKQPDTYLTFDPIAIGKFLQFVKDQATARRAQDEAAS